MILDRAGIPTLYHSINRYMQKHVVPELSKKYNVKLGIMNSTTTFLGLTVDSLKMLAVG